MTLDAARWRPGPLLPPAAGRGIGLFVAVAVLAFLASLAVGGGLFGAYLARDWLRPPPVGSARVTVRASGLESADAAAARAAETLAGVAGVAGAAPLDGPAARAGAPARPDTRSVAVRFKPGATVAPARLASALGADGLAAMVDDHGLLTNPVKRAVVLAVAAAAGVLVLALIISALIAALAARRVLARGHDWVDLLRSVGAADGLIAGLLQRRFAATGARAGLVGALLAIAAFAVWRSMGEPGLATLDVDLPSAPIILWANLAGAAPWPVLMALIGAAMARGAARRMLQRAP